MNNMLTELQAALREAGHGADEVQNAPVDLLNVFLNDEGRVPVATVLYSGTDDGGFFIWGHSWEHTIPTSAPMDDIVRKIIETSQPDA